MRQAGTIANEAEARKFADYLATLGIETRVDMEAEGYGIWVRDDDHLPRAKDELDSFRRAPDDARYQGVEQTARQLRAAQNRKDAQIRKNLIDARKLWEIKPADCPATKLLIAICLLVYAVALLPEKEWPTWNLLRIAPLEDDGRFDRQQGLAAVRQGQVWRIISPIFLHAPWHTGFGVFHLLFNLFWLQDLGTQIEWRRGSLRFVLLVFSIAVASNLAQYSLSGPNFGGMSGVVYGLFGYIWMKSKYDPSAQLGIWPQWVQLMLAWFVVCWLCMARDVANWAHTAGLLMGMAIALVPVWTRKLLKHRR